MKLRNLLPPLIFLLTLTFCQGGAHFTEQGPPLPVQVQAQEQKEVSRGAERLHLFEATAYTYTGYNTASGEPPRPGRTVAVDPKVIPLGTRIYIEGIGDRVALDTGGDIKGNRIDIFFETKEQCIKFGRRPIKVVLGGGQPLGKPTAR